MTTPTDTARDALQALRARNLIAPGLLVEGSIEGDPERWRCVSPDFGNGRWWVRVPGINLACDRPACERGAGSEARDLRAVLADGWLVDDPDTANGALLGAVRKAWGDPTLHVRPLTGGERTAHAWFVAGDGGERGCGDTEFDALCAALAAAPEAT